MCTTRANKINPNQVESLIKLLTQSFIKSNIKLANLIHLLSPSSLPGLDSFTTGEWG